MYVTEKELDAIHAAIDFITSQSDGADDDKYPNDILEGLHSLFVKAKKDRASKHYKYLVHQALKKLRLQKNSS